MGQQVREHMDEAFKQCVCWVQCVCVFVCVFYDRCHGEHPVRSLCTYKCVGIQENAFAVLS